MRSQPRERLLNALLAALSLFFSLAVVEGGAEFALSHPAILASLHGPGGRVLALLRSCYMRFDRHIVQYLPACAVYDPEVSYTLKPGARAIVKNREYRVEYSANRAGLRDDDESLTSPAILVAGDSHAMGWGVASEDAFPKVIQRDLGVSVLNGAMSSYGTAREMALVERLRLHGVKAMVIQYCDNDIMENKYLVDHGRLDIMPERKYGALVVEHARATRYYPFKHVRDLASIAMRVMPRLTAPVAPSDPNAEEARYFAEVLLRHADLVEGRPVVLVELNDRNYNDDRFLRAVTALLDQPRYAALKPWISMVDVSKVLTDADYYVLDDHMRPSGHAKVAHLIEAELKRRGVLQR